ncbi:MAG TPA: hypothetical protein VE690_05905 [Rhodopila sp.]|nr:hypothetical protein [Rhodopila sp.]
MRRILLAGMTVPALLLGLGMTAHADDTNGKKPAGAGKGAAAGAIAGHEVGSGHAAAGAAAGAAIGHHQSKKAEEGKNNK